MRTEHPRALLVRGLVVGLVAGLLAFVVAKLLGEPSVAFGIRFEEARDAASGAEAGPEVLSRTVQNTIGLLTATVVYGVAFGGLFSLAYGYAAGRLGALSIRGTAATVGLLAFLAVYALPALKYPSNPPGVHTGSITERTTTYFLLLLVSVAVVIGGTVLARWLAPRLGAWDATIAVALAGLVVLGLAYAFLPETEPTPVDFDGDVLWRFRLATAAIQATMWTVLALGFGWLTERAAVPSRAEQLL